MGISTIYLKEVSPKAMRAIIPPLMALGLTLGSVLDYFIV
jgi:hypothetical protein